MRGVILAGGRGTRLYPVTKAVNKHLLPIYLHPMILYPLKTLISAGITEIMLISNPGCIEQFKVMLGDGSEYGCQLSYGIQQSPTGGIADAFAVAESFVGDDSVALVLGDNLFTEEQPLLKEFNKNDFHGAGLFLCEVLHPQSFGVATVDENGKITKVVEKPEKPESNMAITGLYAYDNSVFDIIRNTVPSARGELEITDVNTEYLKQGKLQAATVKGEWFDAGSFENLFLASECVRNKTSKLLDDYSKYRLARGLKVDLSFIKMPLMID